MWGLLNQTDDLMSSYIKFNTHEKCMRAKLIQNVVIIN